MPLPRRGSRRDDFASEDRPPPRPGPPPLAAVATAVTLIVLVAAVRTWTVHRPVVLERAAEARAVLDGTEPAVRSAVRAAPASAPLEDVAAAAERTPLTERAWRDEILPAARLLARTDAERAEVLESVPAVARPALGTGLAWDALAPEVRAAEGMPDRSGWERRRSDLDRLETPAVRAAREAVDGLEPRLLDAAERGEPLAAAAALTRGTVLTDVRLREVRAAGTAVETAEDHRRRIGMRMLALALAAAAAWYAVRRERRARRRRDRARDDSPLRRDRHEPAPDGGAALTIMFVGAVLLASRLLVEPAVPGSVTWGLAELVVLHVAASLFVPWRDVRESVVPFVPLLVAWVVAFMVPGVADGPAAGGLNPFDRVVIAMLSPIALLPGVLVAGWRQRVRDDLAEQEELRGRMSFVDDELSRARIVHDAMFPPSVDGEVRFEYTYEPIHEIGGDYVHVHRCDRTGRITVTLLDVAGHGLAAALTVNRLFGELERILAEDASATPREIMELLNRYIHLTMSRHSMFATGTCMTLDPSRGELRWVSAGHPPSILRRADGDVSELETTTMLLGALGPGDFESIEECTTLGPGDVVIAYTDGAFEARNAAGEQFGIDRIRGLVTFDTPPRSWSRFLAGAVENHHGGAADDDVLIASLTLSSLRVERSA